MNGVRDDRRDARLMGRTSGRGMLASSMSRIGIMELMSNIMVASARRA
jgi:hypothetical protein